MWTFFLCRESEQGNVREQVLMLIILRQLFAKLDIQDLVFIVIGGKEELNV